MNNKTIINKDGEGKSLRITREFSAPVERVWEAFTNSELLDKWWAPRPWRTQTKSMNFSVGGSWLYCMIGPNGEQHWSIMHFESIDSTRTFRESSMFCDVQGIVNDHMPRMRRFTKFDVKGVSTIVTIDLIVEKGEDLQAVLNMGFEKGISMAFCNLHELLTN